MDHGTPPAIPTQFQQYNSYVEDPKWQIKFTIIWTSVLAAFVLLYAPYLLRSRMRWAGTIFGLREDWRATRYEHISSGDENETTGNKTTTSAKTRSKARIRTINRGSRSTGQWVAGRVFSSFGAVFYWTIPGIHFSVGQILLIAGYIASVVACIVTQAELLSNSNRAGFLALAQLTPVFLLGTKNSILSLILPPFFSYTRLNPLHRWAGRSVFLAAAIHGSLWINNHLVWDIPILGQQKETSGVAAFGVLCVIVLSSLKWVRNWCWGLFYWIHFLTFPSFFITVCYHTIYAPPWIFPPLAFYAFDLLMRQLRYRIKDAHLIRVDNQMTMIRIPDATTGFRAGQHLRLRVFFDGRGVFEAHPFSIMCAPSGSSCLKSGDADAYFSPHDASGEDPGSSGHAPGVLLGARVVGDWTRALNEHALREEDVISPRPSTGGSHRDPVPVPVQVMFDGPYGGCALDLWDYERVLLVAGGSGATFAIGMLDELVAACCLSEGETTVKTERVDFVWCVRSFGSIKWFAPLLNAIAHTALKGGLILKITVYVTCLCVPEAVPNIPGVDVRVDVRPDVGVLVKEVLGLCEQDTEVEEGIDGSEEEENENEKKGSRDVESGGGKFEGRLGMCASGPASLTKEAANAVARFAGTRVGGRIGLHTEVFAV